MDSPEPLDFCTRRAPDGNSPFVGRDHRSPVSAATGFFALCCSVPRSILICPAECRRGTQVHPSEESAMKNALATLFGFRQARRAARPAPGQRHRARLSVEPLEDRRLLSAVPAFSSLPGAPATLYLDFDGHHEFLWGTHFNVDTPAYDTDGDPSSFSAAEQSAIQSIWQQVAEDYAPFNLNVTTVDPGDFSDGKAL